MYCPKCGSPNDEAARFCMACGVDMEPYRQGAQQIRTASPPPPETPASLSPAPMPEPPSPTATTAVVSTSGLAEGLIPSGIQKAGYGLLELGAIGLFLLWALQWYEGTMAGRSGPFGKGVFMATRGSDALTMGWAFFGLLVATMILLTGLALLPRVGRGLRVGGYALMVIGAVGMLIALLRGGISDALYPLVGLAAVTVVGLLLVQKGTSSFQKEWKVRLGGTRPYRRRWLVPRLGIIAGLWLLGLVGYVLLLVLDDGWTLQPGSYIGGALLALGLLGAIAMLAGLKGRPALWTDDKGEIYNRFPAGAAGRVGVS